MEPDPKPDQGIDDILEQVKKGCASNPIQESNQLISFSDPAQQCAWNQDGNLSQKNQFLRARREQFVPLELPPEAVICDMEFNIPLQEMLFDDEIFLLFNQIYLTASIDAYIEHQQLIDGLPVYNWSTMVNQPYHRDGDRVPYCLGQSEGLGSCTIPYSEKSGPFDLNFDSDLIKKIAIAAGLNVEPNPQPQASLTGSPCLVNSKYEQCPIPENEIQPTLKDNGFTFVTTGDDNSTDCQHKDFAFSVNIKYYLPGMAANP